MEKDNYFLNINWNDLEKNTHRVGFLCLYNDKFYFKIKGKETIRAYEYGFAGMPGVVPNRIYVSSDEMFNILKKRLGLQEKEKEKIEIMKNLIVEKVENESNRIEQLTNQRDKISFEEMNQREKDECKEEIDNIENCKKEESR